MANFDEVFAEELRQIAERRAHVELSAFPGEIREETLGELVTSHRRRLGVDDVSPDATTSGDAPSGPTPSTEQGLAGLAFSGGGIRSATFNLGLAQALEERGVLAHIDYLSTVSGGGYIGSSLSASLGKTGQFPFPVCGEASDPPASDQSTAAPQQAHWHESAPLRHLRTHSSYLVSRNLFDYLRIPVLLLRGWIINFLILMPYVLLAALFTVLVAGHTVREALNDHPVAVASIDLPESGDLARSLPLDLEAALHSNKPLQDRRVRIVKMRPVAFVRKKKPGARHQTDHYEIDTEQLTLLDLPRDVFPIGASEHPVVPGAWNVERSAFADLRLRIGPDAPREFELRVVQTDSAERVDTLGSRLTNGFFLTRLVAAVAIAMLVLFPVGQTLAGRVLAWYWSMRSQRPVRPGKRSLAGGAWNLRNQTTRMLGFMLFALLACAFIEVQPAAIFHFTIWAGVLVDVQVLGLDTALNAGDALSGSVTVLASLLALAANRLATASEGLGRTLGLYTFGLLGPVVLWLVYLTLCRWAIIPRVDPTDAIASDLLVTIGALAGGIVDTLGAFSRAAETALARFGEVVEGLSFGLIAPPRIAVEPMGDWFDKEGGHTVLMVYVVAAIVLFVYGRLFVDLNRTSLHRFYRDRLSKAYLFDPTRTLEDGTLGSNDTQRLETLDTTRAPYHLVNGALNLQASKSGNALGRNAAPFLFSKRYVGSLETGYCRTGELTGTDPHVNLGTAMAISGAAASPNMGTATVRPLVFILALLNVRLGYWLPNPRYLDRRNRSPRRFLVNNYLGRTLTSVGPAKLISEMLGRLRETDAYVNVSDGGHIENLAVIELLRRHCKFIVCGDAEADPGMTFDGLARLMRQARTDLGITIDIDVDALRAPALADGPGISTSHYAVGRIDYGAGEAPGCLLYVKSSVTADEPEDLLKYRADNPAFPHESTADQFFDEAQFESYRALGYHIGSGAFRCRPDVGDLEDLPKAASRLLT